MAAREIRSEREAHPWLSRPEALKWGGLMDRDRIALQGSPESKRPRPFGRGRESNRFGSQRMTVRPGE